MGRIIQKIKPTNQFQLEAAAEGWFSKDAVRSTEVNSLVDTGAAMLCLPLKTIQYLQLKKTKTRKAKTANGVVERSIYGPVTIEVFDRDAIMEVMELPDDGTPALLGHLPLETLDLYPNPKLQILEGNPETDGKMVIDLY